MAGFPLASVVDLALAVIAVELVLIGLLFIGLMSSSASHVAALDLLMSGRFASLFWGVVIVAGILIARRAQRAAVSVVLSAAKTASPGSTIDPDQAALAAALGQTEFEQLREATRTAVREEIAVVDGFRRVALRAQKSGEMLGDLLVQRAEALLKKHGATVGEDGKVVLPEVSGTLPEEVKLLEGIGRLLRTLAAAGRAPLEMERLRIGDPETLRRRLDSVYGGEMGGKTLPTSEGAEADGESAEEPALAVDEVGDTDGWLGLRVIHGGKGAVSRDASSEPSDGAPDETEDDVGDAASTDSNESLLEEEPPEVGGVA
jgi:hypothetical protein